MLGAQRPEVGCLRLFSCRKRGLGPARKPRPGMIGRTVAETTPTEESTD